MGRFLILGGILRFTVTNSYSKSGTMAVKFIATNAIITQTIAKPVSVESAMFPSQNNQPVSKEIATLEFELKQLQQQLEETEQSDSSNRQEKGKEKEYSTEYFEDQKDKIRKAIQDIKNRLAELKAQKQPKKTARVKSSKSKSSNDIPEKKTQPTSEQAKKTSATDNESSSGLRVASASASREIARISPFFNSSSQTTRNSNNENLTPAQKKADRHFKILAKKYEGVFKRLSLVSNSQDTNNKLFFAELEKVDRAIAKESKKTQKELFVYFNIHHSIPPLLVDKQVNLFTLVSAACSRGETKTDAVEALLERGASANVPNNSYSSPIGQAASDLDIKQLDLLIAHGADPNFKDVRGANALHYATDSLNVLKKGQAQMRQVVSKLLAIPGIDVNAIADKPFCETPPLIIALRMNCLAVCKLLLEEGRADVNIIDNYDKTAIHYLFVEKFKETLGDKWQSLVIVYLKLLLNNGARIDFFDKRLPIAVGQYIADLNNLELFKLIIDAANLENPTQRENRCFLLRAMAHKQMVLKTDNEKTYLRFPVNNFEIAIDCLTINEKNRLLEMAILNINDHPQEYLNIVKCLLQNGTDANHLMPVAELDVYINSKQVPIIKNLPYSNETKSHNGVSVAAVPVLFYACLQNNQTLVEILLSHGADPNQSVGSVSPLFLAIFKESIEICRLLLKYGANVNRLGPYQFPFDCNEHELTPLIFAILIHSQHPESFNLEIITLLLGRNEINIHFFSKECGSALHVATKFNHLNIASTLLVMGADPLFKAKKNDLTNESGQHYLPMLAPFGVAIKNQHEEMLWIFIQHLLQQRQLFTIFANIAGYKLSPDWLVRVLQNASIENLETVSEHLSSMLMICFVKNLPNYIDPILNYIETLNENIKTKIIKIFFDFIEEVLASHPNWIVAKIAKEYNLGSTKKSLFANLISTIRNWFEDGIEPNLLEQNSKEKLQENSQFETPNINQTKPSNYQPNFFTNHNSTDNATISARQFLRTMGFDNTEINAMAKQNKMKTKEMLMAKKGILSKEKRTATFLSEQRDNITNPAECNWFNGQLKEKDVICIDNSNPPLFLWIPQDLFDQATETKFKEQRYAMGHYKNIKFFDGNFGKVDRVIKVGQETHRLTFCGELKNSKRERLAIYKHGNLFIALDHVEKGFHKTGTDRHFGETSGREIDLTEYLPQTLEGPILENPQTEKHCRM